MNRTFVLVLILVSLTAPFTITHSNAQDTDKPKIGIMKFEVPEDVNPSIGTFLYNTLTAQMVKSNRYTVVDWEEIDRVLQYISKSQPNISQDEARRQALNQLGIQKMYLGSLVKLGSKYYISVKVLNLDLSVEKVEEATTSGEDGLPDAIEEIATRLYLTPEELKSRQEEAHRRQEAQRKQEQGAKPAPPKAGDVRTFDGIEFVWILPGKFLMGSPSSESGRDSNEGPLHDVTITKGFWLGKTEVTQAQWEKFMSSNPSHFKGTDRPVETVSWSDTTEFCLILSHKTGQTYRLPTEAEWEYACRAGTATAYSYGNDASSLQAYGWYKGNSGEQTHPVAQKLPNPWGLYDMHGNVFEWCEDWYDKQYYASSPDTDPTGPASGQARVLRGGSWLDSPEHCRSAIRGGNPPVNRYDSFGFRIVRTP